jgi:hypothetical protein
MEGAVVSAWISSTSTASTLAADKDGKLRVRWGEREVGVRAAACGHGLDMAGGARRHDEMCAGEGGSCRCCGRGGMVRLMWTLM